MSGKIFCCLFSFILISNIYFAQNDTETNNTLLNETTTSNISLVGSWISGYCNAICNYGELVCFGQGTFFRIMEVKDKSNPEIISSINLHYKYIEEIKVNENFAFVQVEKSEGNKKYLITIDLQDFNSLKILNTLELNPDGPSPYIKNYSVSGNNVFLLSVTYNPDYSWIEIINYDDPIHPTKIGQTEKYLGLYQNIDIEENELFISDRDGSFKIINIMDPTSPDKLIDFKLNTEYERFDVVDSLLYLFDGSGLFKIYNIDNKNKLIEKSNLNLGNQLYPLSIVIENKLVYLIDLTGKLFIIDIANSLSPNIILDDQLTVYCVTGIYVLNKFIYVADIYSGITIYNAENLNEFHKISSFESGDYCYKIVSNSKYLFVSHGQEGYSILDISNPESPYKISKIDGEYIPNLNNLKFNENYAYLINNSFKVIDINNPKSPNLVFSDSTISYASLLIKDNTAYVANDTFFIFDIINSTEPLLIGKCSLSDTIEQYIYSFESNSIKIKDDLAYIAGYKFCGWIAGPGELTILNISDKQNPYLISRFDSLGATNLLDIYIRDNNAYLSCEHATSNDLGAHSEDYWISVLDLGDPSNPFLTDIKLFSDLAERDIDNIYFKNNKIYLVRSNNKDESDFSDAALEIYELTDYNKVSLIGSYPVYDKVVDLEVNDDIIYLAFESQVQILKFDFQTNMFTDISRIVNFELTQNYPNPFNPSTTIKYSIPSEDKSQKVKLKSGKENGFIPSAVPTGRQVQDVRLVIYDILGRKVAVLVNEKQKPGNYEVEWNASNNPSGVYFYKLTTSSFSQTKKMILLR